MGQTKSKPKDISRRDATIYAAEMISDKRYDIANKWILRSLDSNPENDKYSRYKLEVIGNYYNYIQKGDKNAFWKALRFYLRSYNVCCSEEEPFWKCRAKRITRSVNHAIKENLIEFFKLYANVNVKPAEAKRSIFDQEWKHEKHEHLLEFCSGDFDHIYCNVCRLNIYPSDYDMYANDYKTPSHAYLVTLRCNKCDFDVCISCIGNNQEIFDRACYEAFNNEKCINEKWIKVLNYLILPFGEFINPCVLKAINTLLPHIPDITLEDYNPNEEIYRHRVTFEYDYLRGDDMW